MSKSIPFTLKPSPILPAVALLAIVAALCLVQPAPAREWSEEVRMTNANTNKLSGRDFEICTDSRGNIHVIDRYHDVDEEDMNEKQTVYQKFNSGGEALIEPILLAPLAGIPDSTTRGYDIFCDSDDNITLLWGENDYKYISRFNADTDTLISGVQLQSLGDHSTSAHDRLRLAVDSNDNIIIFGKFRYQYPDFYNLHPAYARFDTEGEMLGELTMLAIIWPANPNLVIGVGDTLHFTYDNGIHYYKISPDDERIIDDLVLSDFDQLDDPTCAALDTDDDGRPYFLGTDWDDSEHFLAVLNDNDQLDVLADIGSIAHASNGKGDMLVAGDTVFITEKFHQENFNDGVAGIGFVSYDLEGNLIDSLQLIHDRNESRWRDNERIYRCPDGTIGIVWADERHYDYRAGRGNELYLRYSAPENGINNEYSAFYPNGDMILECYPNPFNKSTLISWKSDRRNALLRISDLKGNIVFNKKYEADSNGYNSFIWRGNDLNGKTLPSGNYFVNINSVIDQKTIRISLIR